MNINEEIKGSNIGN